MSAKPLLAVLVVSMMFVLATPLARSLRQQNYAATNFADAAILDLFTDKGGSGAAMPGGTYYAGTFIVVYANVTYNGEGVADVLVAFEIRNALNVTALCSTARSDLNGIAKINLTLPTSPPEEVLGTWTAVATASVAQMYVTDQLTFQVNKDSPLPGDANGDGKVDVRDATLLCIAWKSKIGDPNYNLNCDFNQDGRVDIEDATIMSMHWLQTR